MDYEIGNTYKLRIFSEEKRIIFYILAATGHIFFSYCKN
jgi:hypothetical protein